MRYEKCWSKSCCYTRGCYMSGQCWATGVEEQSLFSITIHAHSKPEEWTNWSEHMADVQFPCFSFTQPRCSERSFLISRSLFKLGKCYFRSHSKPCYLQLLIFSRNQIEGVNARARWSPVFASTQQVRWTVEGEGRREVKVQQKQR